MKYKTKIAGFSLAELMVLLLLISIAFAAFTPILTKNQTVRDSIGAILPGTIVPYNKVIDATHPAPDGWVLCDGTNGTPDLRGIFVRGLDERTSGNLDPFYNEGTSQVYTGDYCDEECIDWIPGNCYYDIDNNWVCDPDYCNGYGTVCTPQYANGPRTSKSVQPSSNKYHVHGLYSSTSGVNKVSNDDLYGLGSGITGGIAGDQRNTFVTSYFFWIYQFAGNGKNAAGPGIDIDNSHAYTNAEPNEEHPKNIALNYIMKT